MKWTGFCVTTALLLSGCAAAPNVQVVEVCPIPPPLELGLPPGVLEQDFSARMESFLSGRLPEPTSYELPSDSAKLPTIK